MIRRAFSTTAERLFAAWTEPAQLAQWWAPPGSELRSVEVDLRVGGRYRIGLFREGAGLFFVAGVYEMIQRPHRLAFTWRWERPEMDIGESRVTLQFQEKGDLTELTLVHARFPDEAARSAHREGWRGILSNLDSWLNAKGRDRRG